MDTFDEIFEKAKNKFGYRFDGELLDALNIPRQTMHTWKKRNDVKKLVDSIKKLEQARGETNLLAGMKSRKLPPFFMIEQISVNPAIKNALLLQTSAIAKLVCEELHGQAISGSNGEKDSPDYLVWPEYQLSIKASERPSGCMSEENARQIQKEAYEIELKLIDEAFEVTKSIKKIILSLDSGFVQSVDR